MRKLLIAGNWKMNLTLKEARSLAQVIVEKAPQDGRIEVAVCPPFVYLPAVSQAIAGSRVGLGAQNVYFETSGAFTGEVSPAMLLDFNCTYVILGHSERRHILGETDEIVNRKILVALKAGLTPIFCVGEKIEEREAEKTEEVLHRQITTGLDGVSPEQLAGMVIAYEPVWAIGTGKTASPGQAQEAHAYIRQLLAGTHSADAAGSVRIQYGGSVKPENTRDIMRQPDVDGALVGGASLKADSFLGIANEARATIGEK